MALIAVHSDISRALQASASPMRLPTPRAGISLFFLCAVFIRAH